MSSLDTSTLKTFNRLYPQFIKKYETLIPGASDDITDKINSIIENLNNVGQLTNDVVKNWNTVMNWTLNDGLTQNVIDKINSMVADGSFNALFNGSIGDITQLTTLHKDNLVNAVNDNVASLAENVQQIKDLVINVKTPPSPYVGAKGDGSTDDTQALQSLINSAIQNGWTLFVPSGNYVITSTLLFSCGKNSVSNGFKFLGTNPKETVFLAKISSGSVMKFSNINDGSLDHGIEIKDFSIIPFDSSYNFRADGMILENCIGNIYRNIKIGSFNNGLFLTTNADTSIYSTNTGYCEQNVFEDILINNPINGITFQVGANDTWNSSFHGNIFDRVTVSVIGSSTQTAKAINIVSGLIYNCTFNIKMMLGGQNCYLLYFNGDSGTNTGTISYEMFDSNNPKIGTGDNAVAKFFLNGFVYGQLDGGTAIDWSSYTTVQVGQLDYGNNKTAVVAGNVILGRDKFYCLNLIPDKQITGINLYGKTTKLKTLLNTLQDLWGGITHYFVRYQNTSGSQENGFIMAGQEASGAGSRLILGTLPTGSNDIQNLVEGFDIRLTGGYIKSVPNNSQLNFTVNGIGTNLNTVNIAQTKTPATHSATGTTGDICWDSNYIYVCVATNYWGRIPITLGW